MSGSTNAIVDEKIFKSSFCKFVKDELESGGTNANFDEEFLESILCVFFEYAGTNATVDEEFIKRIFCKLLPVVEDALEQKSISIQDVKALHGHFFDRLKRKDPLTEQVMEVARDHLVSPL